MRPASLGRDGEIEALIVDRYLESLLARRPTDPDGVPADLLDTARRLAAGLPRYHPSFRFEEALAARLAAVAAGSETAALLPWRPAALTPAPTRVEVDGGDHGLARPVVIGGVLTSAALSIAGAVFVAWRRTRPADPMSRAVRAVSRARLA